MIGDHGLVGPEGDKELRRSLIDELRTLRRRVRGSNNPPDFAEIRDEHPEIASFLFSGKNLRYIDLSDADLRDLDFRGSDLSGCDFSRARIIGARFEMARLSRIALARAADWTSYRDGWTPITGQREARGAAPAYFRREAGERFSFSPLLPETVILEPDLTVSKDELGRREYRHLRRGCLAIAVDCLTTRELACVVAPDSKPERADERCSWPGYSAQAYCSQATIQATDLGLPANTVVALPSYGLFYALAASEAGAGDPAGTELQAGDLAIGVPGSEFVRVPGPEGTMETASAYSRAAPRRLSEPNPDRNQRARVRPVFLLGDD